MICLSHEIAYQAIRETMSGEKSPGDFTCSDIPFERLRQSFSDLTLSDVDRAVRLRHALRYADLTLNNSGTRHSLSLQNEFLFPLGEALSRFGLLVRAGGTVEAEPWFPNWLVSTGDLGVDATAAQAQKRKWTNLAPVADPWVTDQLNFKDYRGIGQALAVRSALQMPTDKTLLILLPTGEGKSLVFQTLACANPGKTVAVVVPTVALALDHAAAVRNFQSLLPDIDHAYIGGADSKNEVIRSAVAKGHQGLLFAAPEAMVMGLRQSLLDSARDGNLAAIVIDEAHLVDAWGTDFRSEFQLLSALIEDLRDVSPINKKPSVVCLSATVTQESLETLDTLFSPHQPISIIPASRLRPEQDIWIAPVCQLLERKKRVLEALCHLPRPAILYVTQQKDANEWYEVLREEGFRRLGKVHGGTSTDDRERVIKAWRSGELDLVVGTSAFGLGIDFPHVRTVIHACVPESLDRYYQEIGRSGRDNCASIALLIPADSDFTIAESLSVKKIIGVEKGLGRWTAMFNSKVRDINAPTRFLVDPSLGPSYDIDMQSERNEDWNARVLTLMSRAGLIRLAGLRYDAEKNRGMIAVDIIDTIHHHLAMSTWKNCVEPLRQRSRVANSSSYEGMLRLIEQRECPSVLLRKLYELNHNGQIYPLIEACGGCFVCRSEQPQGWFAKWPSAPIPPFSIGRIETRLEEYFDQRRCFVEWGNDDFKKQRQRRRLSELIDALWDFGLRKCIVLGEPPDALWDGLKKHPWCVAKPTQETGLSSNGLPPGPTIVWINAGYTLGADKFLPRNMADERIFFLPVGFQDPGNPDCMFSERRTMITFDNFHDRLIS